MSEKDRDMQAGFILGVSEMPALYWAQGIKSQVALAAGGKPPARSRWAFRNDTSVLRMLAVLATLAFNLILRSSL